MFSALSATDVQCRNIGDLRAVEPLIALLDADELVAVDAAVALGQLKDRRAVPALIRLATADDLMVGPAAVDALAAIGDPAAVMPLIGLLDDDSLTNAIEALAALGDQRAVQPLLDQLANPDADHMRVVAALGTLKATEAVPMLIDSLDAEDLGVSYMAIAALGRIGDPRAMGPLIAIIDRYGSEGQHQGAVATALSNITGDLEGHGDRCYGQACIDYWRARVPAVAPDTRN